MHTKTLYLVVLAAFASNALSAPVLGLKKPSTPPPVVAKGPTVAPPAKGLTTPPPPAKGLTTPPPPAKGLTTPPPPGTPAKGVGSSPPPAKGLGTGTSSATPTPSASAKSTTSGSGSIANPGKITLNGKALTLTFFAQGTRGVVFNIKENPNELAKRSKTGESLTQEGVNTKAAGQLIDEGTASDGHFYLIIKKIPGNPLNKTPAAKKAGKDCALLMAAARNLAATAAAKYATPPFDIKHGDLALGNILFTDSVPGTGSGSDSDDEDSGLAAADLIDWGIATRTSVDKNSFKLQVKQSLSTTLGFRDEDCADNWANIKD